jgi:hypothetical protein
MTLSLKITSITALSRMHNDIQHNGIRDNNNKNYLMLSVITQIVVIWSEIILIGIMLRDVMHSEHFSCSKLACFSTQACIAFYSRSLC